MYISLRKAATAWTSSRIRAVPASVSPHSELAFVLVLTDLSLINRDFTAPRVARMLTRYAVDAQCVAEVTITPKVRSSRSNLVIVL